MTMMMTMMESNNCYDEEQEVFVQKPGERRTKHAPTSIVVTGSLRVIVLYAALTALFLAVFVKVLETPAKKAVCTCPETTTTMTSSSAVNVVPQAVESISVVQQASATATATTATTTTTTTTTTSTSAPSFASSSSSVDKFGEPQVYFGPVETPPPSSSKTTTLTKKEECTCEMKGCEACHRAIFSEHKMGHVLTHKIHDKFFPELLYLPGHWDREARKPPAEYRHILVTRNFYDAILSGYLYHKRGTECFDPHTGQPLTNNWIYARGDAWDAEVRQQQQQQQQQEEEGQRRQRKPDWPAAKGRCICQYLAEESEQDGLRVFVEWAYYVWYAPLVELAQQTRARELAAGKQMTLHMCMEELMVEEDFPKLIQQMNQFLYPYYSNNDNDNNQDDDDHHHPNAMKNIEPVSKGTVHATTKDQTVRSRLRAMIAQYDQELLGGVIAFHSNEFGCGQLDGM